MRTQLIDKLQESLQRHGQIATDSNLIVAVSGGADSLALLHALAQLRKTLSFVIHAATLNHGLRASAAGDVAFVQDFAETLHIPVTTGQVNVPELARIWKMSIEAAARKARYHFLAGVAQQVGANTIVTAHHAGDQAETILMHILRGSGLNGLQGMAYVSPVPDYPNLHLFRPVLAITRAEIETYCAENHLHPRHDETNDDPTILRNKIRLEMLPYLAQVNPNIAGALTRLGDIVRVEQDYLRQQFERDVRPHIQRDHNWLSLPRAIFENLHPAMQRQFVIYAASQMHDRVELNYDRVVEALTAANHKIVGKIIQFGEGLQLRLEYERVVLEVVKKRVNKKHSLDRPEPDLRGFSDYCLLDEYSYYHLEIPGVTYLPRRWIIRASYELPENWQAQISVLTDNVEGILRNRLPGDIFRPLGMGGKSQKLKEWLINHKVPREIRDYLPLLVINGEIAAILLKDKWVISETFAVRESTDRIVYLSVINAVDISEQS